MARVFTKDILMNSGDIQNMNNMLNQRENAASESRRQFWNSLSNIFTSMNEGAAAFGKAYVEQKAADDRYNEIMKNAAEQEYKNDPMFEAAAKESAKTGSSAPLNSFISQWNAAKLAKTNEAEKRLADQRTIASWKSKLQAANDYLDLYGKNEDYKQQVMEAKRQKAEAEAQLATYGIYDVKDNEETPPTVTSLFNTKSGLPIGLAKPADIGQPADKGQPAQTPDDKEAVESSVIAEKLKRYSGLVDEPTSITKFITEEERENLEKQIKSANYTDTTKAELLRTLDSLPTREQNEANIKQKKEKKKQEENEEFWRGKARDEAAEKRKEKKENDEKLTKLEKKIDKTTGKATGLTLDDMKFLQEYGGWKFENGIWSK